MTLALDPWRPNTIADDPSNVSPTATRGMIIDAGSGGSRLHVFSWKPRVFKRVPPPLSYPEANEQWTARIDPGIHNFVDSPSKIYDHLAPLIDFAKIALVGNEKEFSNYPIYFKATGGMREIETPKREAIMQEVRRLLSDKSFCPFFFKHDHARVISGEEEAVFSWTATNFLMGTLLPNSEGLGEISDVNSTYGTLDLGGASTQIAFFVPSQDIEEGLYKLQIGGQKMWNVYTKSFLQFGVVSARVRHLTNLVDDYLAANNEIASARAINSCFHSGYSEQVHDSTDEHVVEVAGPPQPQQDQLSKCRESLKPLMEKELGKLCNEVYHGDCSIAGAYQPPIPTGRHGHFIGTSSYKYPWAFLQLPKTATLDQFEQKARYLCQMNFAEMMLYYENSHIDLGNDKVTDFLPYYCFLSGYILTLLEDGYRFQKNQTLTVLDEVNGHRVGWALGAILYEINELPWVLKMSPMESHPFRFVFLAAVIGFILGLIASYFVYREIVEDKKPKRRDAEDSFEELRRLNTIDLIRQRQNNMSASTDFIPMQISHKPTNKAASETSENSNKSGSDWLNKWTERKPLMGSSQYQQINDI